MQPKIAISRRLRSTPWTSRIQQQGVKGFTVYNHMLLPTEFKSVEEDYWHLCEHVQVWDVGAERQVEIVGHDADKLVQWMTPRNISNVANDQCVYLPLVDENGKLMNDPVGVKVAHQHWWLSVADSDVWLWAKGLAQGAKLNVLVREPAVWPLAVQGPKAETLMARIFGDAVKDIGFFRYARLDYQGHAFIVARSGWSKQGGFEVYVDDAALGQALYDELFDKGEDLHVGPGCPNLIERIESGLLSFGNDMDFDHSPIEVGLEKFLHLDADIDSMSLAALRTERDNGATRKLIGLVISAPDGSKPIDETAFSVLGRNGSSFIGSQVWSPRYKQQLACAIVDTDLLASDTLRLTMSDGATAVATITEIPFNFNALGLSHV